MVSQENVLRRLPPKNDKSTNLKHFLTFHLVKIKETNFGFVVVIVVFFSFLNFDSSGSDNIFNIWQFYVFLS